MDKRFARSFAILVLSSSFAFAQQGEPSGTSERGVPALGQLLDKAGEELEPLK